MTKFFFKFKKPFFWLIFGPFPNLGGKIQRNLMIQFQQNIQIDNIRMDRPYFIGLFHLVLTVQQVKLQ